MFMQVDMSGKKCVIEVEKTTQFHIMTQLQHARYNFCLIHGAKVVQAGWRRLVKYRRETGENFRESKQCASSINPTLFPRSLLVAAATRNRNRNRHATATRIQAHARRRIAAEYVERVRQAKFKVAMMLQARFRYQHLLRLNIAANKHSIKRIFKTAFAHLVINHAMELEEKVRMDELELPPPPHLTRSPTTAQAIQDSTA